ncbi:ankyrin repeat domain-containing protein [Muriicola sp. Z0-33]|uniref:ankyrin repeat domain-containing protein n=1 Tax=Muriicola sp. Z0-33 TaxID=2816957 RepID=UPI002238A878|nr:ankyrin repeat domain-containing protein [Muriicola sp. Z0-33]MCW5517617.1 ankyrin repeat domain-containing protein [Muriicola sp. Z0-33]
MRKTILTVAVALMLAVSGVYAGSNSDSDLAITSSTIANAKLNSFCKAIMQGDIDTVKRMIELGEDVNEKSLGMSPAIFAARYNKAEILELLIENGADITVECDKGFTAKKHAELSNAVDALAVIENAMKS